MMALTEIVAESIGRVCVSFIVSGPSIDPDEITSVLRIKPDRVVKKGEKSEPFGIKLEARSGLWSVDSTSTSKDVNEHIRELLSRLEPVRGALERQWELTFEVLYKASHLGAGSGPFFEADVVVGIAQIGANISQDLYCEDAQ